MRTECVPKAAVLPDGRQFVGESFFHLVLLEPGGDPVVPGPYGRVPLLAHRRSDHGQSITEQPPPSFGGATAVTVPSALLDALPDDGIVIFECALKRPPHEPSFAASMSPIS